MDEKAKAVHSLSLENRGGLKLTGVVDVGAFDEETIVVYTEYGCLTISGEALHIEELNLDSGKLAAAGKISALVYSSDSRKNGGFFKRIFGA